MLYPLHQSIVMAMLLFISFGTICISLYYGINKWNKEEMRE